MAFSRNLCVKLRASLCGVQQYASASALVFLDLVKKFSFLDWKHYTVSPMLIWMDTCLICFIQIAIAIGIEIESLALL